MILAVVKQHILHALVERSNLIFHVKAEPAVSIERKYFMEQVT